MFNGHGEACDKLGLAGVFVLLLGWGGGGGDDGRKWNGFMSCCGVARLLLVLRSREPVALPQSSHQTFGPISLPDSLTESTR